MAGVRAELEAGDRVIVASATGRSRDVLGTVIETDPYEDRDLLVRVLFEDESIRWRRRDELRGLGHRTPPDALASDLALMGIALEGADG